MKFLFKNEVLDYDYHFSNQKKTILFLHGWGGNKFSFQTTINLCKKNFNVLTITLPTTQPTTCVFDLFDYVECVEKILKIQNISSVILICHSFGFRIALILKEKLIVEKIVVTGGAGIKIENKFKKLNKIDKNNTKIWLKNNKIKNLFEKTASKDYLELSSINKKTFKNIVNLNLKFLAKFSCPMLLFWGKNDSATPVAIANYLNKNNNAKLIILNSDHFAFLTNNSQFNHTVLNFII